MHTEWPRRAIVHGLLAATSWHDESNHRGAERHLKQRRPDNQRQRRGAAAAEPGADVRGRNLKEAGEEGPQPDDFVPIDPNQIRAEQHRRQRQTQHRDWIGQPLAPRFSVPESAAERRKEEDRLAQADAKEKLEQVCPNPHRLRPSGFDVESCGMGGDLPERAEQIEAESD